VTDPVETEILRLLLIAVAEEMGVALERTAYSPNIKERRDHSCAAFDAAGNLVAQAAHIPVHLGAFPEMMRVVAPRFDWRPGDVVLCNDPYVGGTHLPDISLISPVFASGGVVGFVANRAHHADVGGAYPGSLAMTTEIYQEGVIIPPLKLVEAGETNPAVLELLCRNVRTPEERRGDLQAQLAANATGVQRLGALAERYGAPAFAARLQAARRQSAAQVRAALAAAPAGEFVGEDWLDDDGQSEEAVLIRVSVRLEAGRMRLDFSGSAAQRPSSVNATLAVTHSAAYYCLFCLLPKTIELNQGVFDPVEVVAPPGTIVNARPPAAVAAGNVETSQRIVDAVFRALAPAFPERIPAASQGTMNNLTMGGAGEGRPWAYYETVGGGAGGSPERGGVSGIHCHMSNTRNTPAEALEYHYPLRVWRNAIRSGSGGAGAHPGGEGIVRELELLGPAQLTLLTDRRRRGPYGLAGGEAGRPGRNAFRRGEAWEEAPGKVSAMLAAGDRVRVETPGGGGWGAPAE